MADLPDDLTRWPSDPYTLLDVKPGAPTREMRKAYTELIRRFKPERFPDHFRRIREAYDQVQQSELWRAYDRPPDPPPPASPENTTVNETPPLAEAPPPRIVPASEPIIDPPVAAPPVDRDKLWDLACNGDHERVYRQLRDQVERGGADEAVYLQLYWLRVAFPEVDLDVKPLDWPVRAIAAGFEHGRSFEMIHSELLYRRELCRDAALKQLAERMRDAGAIVRLLEIRWRAALDFGQWSMVLDELSSARERLFDQPAMWASLVSWLVGWMAWSREEHVQRQYRACRKELESVVSGNRTFDYVLERLDFLDELVGQWRTLAEERFLHRDIRDLLPISWTGTSGEIRWRIFGLFQRLVNDVAQSLSALDALAHSEPLVLAQVVLTAQQTYFASRGQYRPTQAEVVGVFNAMCRATNDSPLRVEMLDLLASERLSVDDFLANVPVREASESVQRLLEQLASDNALRLVNLAQLVMGG